MSFKIIKNIITKKKEEDECANSLLGETLAEYNIPEENVGNEKDAEVPPIIQSQIEQRENHTEELSDNSNDKNYNDDMTKDLMVLIGDAISVWAKKYGLEKMPTKVVFEQALAIMNAIYKTMDY